MILADKIINERKKNGWSQEDLANMLSVSRQSVSKWEGAQAVPDLNRIIKMAELFNVSTDYLLKDEVEIEKTAEYNESVESSDNLVKISLEDADRYIKTIERNTPTAMIATALFVLCPVLLIFLAGVSGFFPDVISENTAVIIGLAALFLSIAAGVVLWIMIESKESEFKTLNKENFETMYGVEGMVKEKKNAFSQKSTILTSIGVILCILSPVPIIFTGLAGGADFAVICCVCLLLIMIACAVSIFIYTTRINSSYNKLLSDGRKNKERFRSNQKLDRFGGIYWCLVVAIFMFCGLSYNKWQLAGVIFPIAGVLYAAVMGIIKIAIGHEDED